MSRLLSGVGLSTWAVLEILDLFLSPHNSGHDVSTRRFQVLHNLPFFLLSCYYMKSFDCWCRRISRQVDRRVIAGQTSNDRTSRRWTPTKADNPTSYQRGHLPEALLLNWLSCTTSQRRPIHIFQLRVVYPPPLFSLSPKATSIEVSRVVSPAVSTWSQILSWGADSDVSSLGFVFLTQFYTGSCWTQARTGTRMTSNKTRQRVWAGAASEGMN